MIDRCDAHRGNPDSGNGNHNNLFGSFPFSHGFGVLAGTLLDLRLRAFGLESFAFSVDPNGLQSAARQLCKHHGRLAVLSAVIGKLDRSCSGCSLVRKRSLEARRSDAPFFAIAVHNEMNGCHGRRPVLGWPL